MVNWQLSLEKKGRNNLAGSNVQHGTLVPVQLDKLDQLDWGALNMAFATHMKNVVKDCIDRPGEKKKRSITLKFVVEPEHSDGGMCERVLLNASVASSIPAHKTADFQCAPTKKGDLLVNPVSPAHVDQMTINQEINDN